MAGVVRGRTGVDGKQGWNVMRIRELHLMNFGKVTDTHIYFPGQLHVIFGENEYGKSTIYAFIKAMLFGLERGKGRAAKNDTFSRYEPWENPNYYAGMMRFTCGGRNFRLERHFDRYHKSAELICEDDGEELSVENGDLEMLLGGIGEASFENMAAIGRLSAKPGQDLAAELKNFAANYYETGSGEIDLSGALERLKIRAREVQREQKKLQEAREQKIRKTEDRIGYVEDETERLQKEIADAWEHLAAEEEKRRAAVYRAEQEKNTQQREDPRSRERQMAEQKRTARQRTAKRAGSILALLGILLLLSGWMLHFPTAVIGAAVGIFAGGIGCLLWGYLSLGRPSDAWERTYPKAAEQKTEEQKEPDRDAADREALEERVYKLKWKIEQKQSDLKEKQVLKNNLEEQLREEEMRSSAEKKLDRTLDALELAGEHLKDAAHGMSDRFGEQLNRHASEILSEITDGKYGRLFVEDGLELSVYSEGKRLPAERLSRGTIEQIYFSLRMAALDLMYEEEIPLILDDAFSSYDEKRLKSALKWLSRQPRQVIIFSCQKREEEIIKMF